MDYFNTGNFQCLRLLKNVYSNRCLETCDELDERFFCFNYASKSTIPNRINNDSVRTNGEEFTTTFCGENLECELCEVYDDDFD